MDAPGEPGGMRELASPATSVVLDQLVRLAAGVAGTPVAVLVQPAGADGPAPAPFAFGLPQHDAGAVAELAAVLGPGPGLTVLPDLPGDGRFARHALVAGPPHFRFLAHLPLFSASGERRGTLCVLDPGNRAGLTDAQAALLGEVASLIVVACEGEQRHAQLMRAASRALRADRMLHLVSEAASCAEALTSVLGELCRFHGAAVGRIWQLTQPGELMVEISRFNGDELHEHSYYRQPPAEPINSDNSVTAEAIRRNQPQTLTYSEVPQPERYALLPNAITSGLASQVSYPMWVQDQRFGIALLFADERPDLPDIVADIASLANTIRPALFRKVTEERIRFVALHDDLTQLANRLLFQERLASAIASAEKGEHGLALLYLDLDGFKLVNDQRGHVAGDRLLAAVARRLRDHSREGDTTARIGGDEFAIIQPLGGQPSAATALAERLLQAIREPFDIDGRRSVIGASVGIAVYPGGGETPDALLRNADTALYRAKESGRNTYLLFEPSMDVRQQQRALIEQDMGQAIERQHFILAYQPICHAASLEVAGFESLLRWAHPTRGHILPDHFVPLAEANGLILPLGRWALETACAEAARWDPTVGLSVNLSPTQFRQPDLAQQVAEVLERTGLPGERLDLEVTEGLLLNSSATVLRTMRALKELGVRMTLDDFGTAYASLSYLRRFPFDRIKIDKSFVKDICSDDGSLAIVEAILLLGARLGLGVVAEGVETEQQLDLLRRLGCRLVQGFLTGKPEADDRGRLSG